MRGPKPFPSFAAWSRALAAVAFFALAGPAHGQITNGGFESGDLTAWTAGGGASVEALQSTAFSPGITPPEGDWFAILSTGPGDVPSAPGGDFDSNAVQDFDATTLSTSFNTTSAGERLSFSWAFLTGEVGQSADYDDLFDIQIDGISILRGSVNLPGGVSPFPDTAAYDGVAYTVSSAGPADGNTFGSGVSPLRSLCIAIADPGVHTLEFLVADQSDSFVDSALLVDDVQAPSTCNASIAQITDTTGVNLEIKGGGLVFARQENWNVEASQDGTVLAFVGSSNLTGDNPNLVNQVFVASGGGFERVTASSGGHIGNPSMTSNGRWIVFESSDDLLPGSPGNADGNIEIFRWDRTSSVLTQLSDTTDCSNLTPTICHNSAGRRIAFSTDCTDLDPGFNGDGNREIVIYNTTNGTYQYNETSGCDSSRPSISRHNVGRYVSFVSTCDPTGGNSDGNHEVFQWNRSTNALQQITSSTPPVLTDGTASSFDGAWVAYVSDGDPTGQNADGNLEVFRWSRAAGSVQQITDTSGFILHPSTDIDDTGQYLAVERLDILSSTFTVLTADASSGTLIQVASGDATLPAISVSGGNPGVAFQSTADFTGNNPDGNGEIWQSSQALAPPDSLLHCSNPGTAIPDNNPTGVSDTLSISDTLVLQDLDVQIEITHTWVGDLTIILEHVATGTTVTLVNRPGSPPGFGCSGDDFDATLDDDAASPVEDQCVTPGPIAIEGRFTSDDSLSSFAGENLLGDWQLTVQDLAGGDTGTVVQWCLVSTS